MLSRCLDILKTQTLGEKVQVSQYLVKVNKTSDKIKL